MMRAFTLIATTVLLSAAAPAFAAVGCTLNDPDRDIIRIFPDATSYRTEFVTIEERGGDSLAERIEAALGDTLDPIYEGNDVAYAYYTVVKGTDVIGRVHGVNQKGAYGGMQLILATDLDGSILDFYYQKLSSPDASSFRDDAFTGLFRGLSVDDFVASRSAADWAHAGGAAGRIASPTEEVTDDFQATIRGVTKNLILLREFHGVGRENDEREGGSDDED